MTNPPQGISNCVQNMFVFGHSFFLEIFNCGCNTFSDVFFIWFWWIWQIQSNCVETLMYGKSGDWNAKGGKIIMKQRARTNNTRSRLTANWCVVCCLTWCLFFILFCHCFSLWHQMHNNKKAFCQIKINEIVFRFIVVYYVKMVLRVSFASMRSLEYICLPD